MIGPNYGRKLRQPSRAAALACAAALMLIAGVPLRAQVLCGAADPIFAQGFQQSRDCSGVAPLSIRRQFCGYVSSPGFQGLADFTDYLATFSSPGVSWPGTPGGRSFVVESFIPGTSNYLALRFDTGAIATGSIGSYRIGPSPAGPSATYLSISECPGDFTSLSLDDRCELGPTAEGELYWIVGPSSSGFRCVLDRQKTYYLNMVQADPSNIAARLCASSTCSIEIGPSF